MHRSAALIVAALILAACSQTGGPEPGAAVPPGVTPSTFAMPAAGTGCAGDIARFQAVADNDFETGNANKSVHDKIVAELARATAACDAGRDAEASRLVAQSRSRHGY